MPACFLSRGLPLIAALATTLGLTSCKPATSSSAAGEAGPPVVVATTTMIADMARDIGGEHIRVQALMGPGVDPHLYKASAEDSRSLSDASAVFYNGLMLEGRMAETFDRLKSGGRKVFALSDALDHAALIHPGGATHPDPHIWGDAGQWEKCVAVMVRGLSEVAPEHRQEFESNGAKVKAGYAALHQWAKDKVASLPEASRILITSHDAFNYFGRAYGLQVVGVQGISTVSEAGLADITKTVDFIRENKVKAVFVETSVPPAAIERISRDSGAKIGGELFSDALGTPGDIVVIDGEKCDKGTYIGMLKSNVHTIVEALK